MHVLALCSQEGGSGKTTLSGHLAVHAERVGAEPVALIDTDPQGSLAALVERASMQLDKHDRQRLLDQPAALGFGRRAVL